jgi:ATP-binding cassette subfamily B protein
MVSLAKESKSKSLSLAKVQSLFGPLMLALIGISNLVVIYFGGLMYIEGTIKSIGTIAEFILYVNMLTWPVASLGIHGSRRKLHKKRPKNLNNQTAFPNQHHIGTSKHLFRKERRELAILGKTGSGKSTILALISRLYDVTDGKITIDDQEISSLNLYDLNSIGIVPQDAFFFSDSIKSNIKFVRRRH